MRSIDKNVLIVLLAWIVIVLALTIGTPESVAFVSRTENAPAGRQETVREAPIRSESRKKGLTVVFRYRGENSWVCEKAAQKPAVIIETHDALRLENLPELCDGIEPPEDLIAGLAGLFSYGVEFLTDIAEGDQLSVYIQKSTGNSDKNEPDPILAANISTGGKNHLALYYELSDGYAGYFDEVGKSLEKSFLKSPLDYRRITSRYSASRLHPIFKVYRPHYGIDYAAPAGTPVSAIGNGKITYIGRRKGYGRYIRIRHPNGYVSSYGHLARFEDGIRKGKNVLAGDVIGYVGQSGTATGPHLDFRIYKNDRPINFLEIESPHRRRVPVSSYVDFYTRYEFYLSVLTVE